jgi:hypothetical protein
MRIGNHELYFNYWEVGLCLNHDEDCTLFVNILNFAAFIRMPDKIYKDSLGQGFGYGFCWPRSLDMWDGIHFNWGMNTKIMNFPFRLKWYETRVLLKNTEYAKGDNYDDIPDVYIVSVPYRYVLQDGTEQKVTATAKEFIMEWRRPHLFNLPILRKKKHFIDVRFDKPIGEGVHDWKGGVMGVSYDILKNESIQECINRMEKERKFK